MVEGGRRGMIAAAAYRHDVGSPAPRRPSQSGQQRGKVKILAIALIRLKIRSSVTDRR